MVCGAVKSLVPKGSCKSLIELACGMFMTISVLSSFSGLTVNIDPTEWVHSGAAEGKAAASIGEDLVYRELHQCIKQEAEEYILNKAAAMNIRLSVEVTLSDSDIPVPVAVTVFSSVNPAIQERLEYIISEDLGISKENQQWMDTSSGKE